MTGIKDLINKYIVSLLCNTLRKLADNKFKMNNNGVSLKETYKIVVSSYVRGLDTGPELNKYITNFLTYCATVDRAVEQGTFMKNIVREFCPPGVDTFTGSNRDTLLGRKVLLLTIRECASRMISSDVTIDCVANASDVAIETCSKLVSEALSSVRNELMTEGISKKNNNGLTVPADMYNSLKKRYESLVSEVNNMNTTGALVEQQLEKLISALRQTTSENASLKQRLREREVPHSFISDTDYQSEKVDRFEELDSMDKKSARGEKVEKSDKSDKFDTDNSEVSTTSKSSKASKASGKSKVNKSIFKKLAEDAQKAKDNISVIDINPNDSVSSVETKDSEFFEDGEW